MTSRLSTLGPRLSDSLARPAGRPVAILLAIVALAAPAWLFADALEFRRLRLDDFAFLGASRTLRKAVANLFVPHNAHIVPAWRLLTWAIGAMAGSLRDAPRALEYASIGVVMLAMLATGRLVQRETGSTAIGLAAMAGAGTTSILKAAATWYSAGQTFWAGLGILGTLLALQSWKAKGGGWRLGMAALGAVVAGGFWTIGHAAGPAGAVYLLADGTKRSRRAAIVPMLASVAAVAMFFGMGARRIEVDVKFSGTDKDKAMSVRRGALHTLHSISETLVVGNIGVAAEMAPSQAAVLTLTLIAVWASTLRRGRRPSPLECAGGAMIGLGYLVSWTFRGYYEWVNLRGVVPWYDTIPHLGAVLFASGWWGRKRHLDGSPRPLTRGGSAGVLTVILGLVAIHQPRANREFMHELPPMTEAETKAFPIESLQLLRARIYAELLVKWHREHLLRLDRAEAEARRRGIGRDLIRSAFGRVEVPGLPEVYDAAEMLDLPAKGTATDVEMARSVLGPYFVVMPAPAFPLEEILRSVRKP